MPQLDLVTFFSQYLWLVIFYLGFYLALVHVFLPKLARILKVRAAMIQSGVSASEENTTALQEARDLTAVTTLKVATSAFTQGIQTLGTWVTTTKSEIKQSQKYASKKYTEKYTGNLQENARLQALVQKNVKALLPLSSYANLEGAALQDPTLQSFHTKTMVGLVKPAKKQKQAKKRK